MDGDDSTRGTMFRLRMERATMGLSLVLLLLTTLLDVAVSFSGTNNHPCRGHPFRILSTTATTSTTTTTTTTSLSSSSSRNKSAWGDWSAKTGDSALRQVQFLASKVAESTASGQKFGKMVGKRGPKSVRGTGRVVFNNPEFNRGIIVPDEESPSMSDEASILNPSLEIKVNSKREEQVWTALANLELDSKFDWRDMLYWTIG